MTSKSSLIKLAFYCNKSDCLKWNEEAKDLILKKLHELKSERICCFGIFGSSLKNDVLLSLLNKLSNTERDYEAANCCEGDGIYIWSEPLQLITDNNESIEILIMITNRNSSVEEGKQQEFKILNALLLSLSTSVLYILDYENNVENEIADLKQFLDLKFQFHGNPDSDTAIPELRLLLQNTPKAPYGSRGGKEFTETTKYSENIQKINHNTQFKKFSSFALPKKEENFFKKHYNTLLEEIVDADNVFEISQKCSVKTSLFNIDTQKFSIRGIQSEEEDEIEEFVDVAVDVAAQDSIYELAGKVKQMSEENQEVIQDRITRCYNIYFEMMKTNYWEPKRSCLIEFQKFHEEYRNLSLKKFVLECRQDGIMEDIEIYQFEDTLREQIENFKKFVTQETDAQIFHSIQKATKYSKQSIQRICGKLHSYLNIPNNKEEFQKYLNQKFKNPVQSAYLTTHPAVIAAANSFENNWSSNAAYIYLVGASGEGKSSTINFLFGKDILPTGVGISVTMNTTAYSAHVKKNALKIENLHMSFIDGPGLEDTKKKDEMHLTCHRKFIETHPQLKNSKPNIVMIVHNVGDTRLGDDVNDDTKFVRVLRRINGALKSKLINTDKPNVVFVLTKLQSDVTKTYLQQITTVKKLAYDILRIKDAPVIPVENFPAEHGLYPDANGWYHLLNGDKHPLKLFSELIRVCENNSDFIGQEAISKFFSQAEKSKVFKSHEFLHYNVPKSVQPNLSTNASTRSEIRVKLESYFTRINKMEQEMVGVNAPYTIAQFLENKEIRNLCEVPQGEEFRKLLKHFSGATDNTLEFAAMALGVELPRGGLIAVKVGSSYDIIHDTYKGLQIYELGENICSTGTTARLTIPEYVEVHLENRTFSRCLEFSSKEEYMQKRWFDLNANVDIPANALKIGNVNVKCGYSFKESSTGSSTTLMKTILLESHVYSFNIPDNLQVSNGFLMAINRLPETFNLSDKDNVMKWKLFLDKYGTHVIQEAWAGGSCVASLDLSSVKDETSAVKDILCELEARMSGASGGLRAGGGNNNSGSKSSVLSTTTIEMHGGDPQYHCTSFQNMDGDIMLKWRDSIQYKPIVLTTKLGLISLGSVIDEKRPEIAIEFSKALKYFIGGDSSISTNKSQNVCNVNVVEIQRPELSSTSRAEATKATTPKVDPNWFQKRCSIL